MSLQPITVQLSVDGPQNVPLNVDTGQSVQLHDSVHIVQQTTTDYELLDNKPSVNGVELIGNKTSADLGIDRTYVHNQTVAAATWTITHNLDKKPSVTVVDSADSVVVGDVAYLDNNSLMVTFVGAFSGKAYLN